MSPMALPVQVDGKSLPPKRGRSPLWGGGGGFGPSVIEFARGDSASLTRSDCGTMRDTVIFAAFVLLLILAVVLLARFIVP
jgi:hypothetical protein